MSLSDRISTVFTATKSWRLTCVLGAVLALAGGLGQGIQPTDRLSDTLLTRGQVLYVPAYSHIFAGTALGEFNLTTTLSIRNTDRSNTITVTSVRYYDSAGALARTYLEEPHPLGPLASTAFVVEERDMTGGVGASFIIEWSAQESVTAPVAEAVMISTASGQGLSFITWARVLEHTP